MTVKMTEAAYIAATNLSYLRSAATTLRDAFFREHTEQWKRRAEALDRIDDLIHELENEIETSE